MTKQPSYTIDDELFVPDDIVDIEEDREQVPKLKMNDDKLAVSDEGIADIEEDGEPPVHDQLPSVEEAKLNIPSKPSNSMTFKQKAILLLLVTVVIPMVVVVALATKNHKKKKLRVQANASKDRVEAVVQFLRKNNISNEPSLRDKNSPQHHAARFMAVGDVYGMELTEETAEQFLERYVLVLLYYTLHGEEWTYNLQFMSARNHCDWNSQFLTTTGRRIDEGVYCDENGYVNKLVLEYNNVRGVLPTEIRWLGRLVDLNMQFNPALRGGFPGAFREMSNLKSVGLTHCDHYGELPSWLGELTQLTALGLGNNRFYGAVPSSIVNLKNLKLLALDDLGLSGNIDLFKNMYQIETLFLEKNILTGEVTNALVNWRHMQELDLSDNMLDGPIPKSLFDLEQLVVADLSHNLLDGRIAEDIFKNTALQYLSLFRNAIRGTIPDRVGFLENLKHLDLSFNSFSGTIPDTIARLTGLRSLATSGNMFGSQHLLDLSKMSSLHDLSMKGNNITGTIPDWIGDLSGLQLLDLDANKLSGSIPTWMGLLTGLNNLLLNRNHLTGTIPTQLANMRDLDVLLLDSNSITGTAKSFCDADAKKPTFFIADCYPGQDGTAPEIDCRCCTTCCNDGDPNCNNKAWTSNVDPIWEYGFVRPNYRFDLSNAPAMYSKTNSSSQP